MKTKTTFLIVACFTVLCLFSSTKANAQNGPNLLINSDFANVTDLATNTYGTKFVWPDDWVLVSEQVLYNEYPVWKVWYWEDGTPDIGSWTGTPSEGYFYQELTGLENGTYEFSFTAAGGGANDSKYALFATGYGGDSIAVPFIGTPDWKLFSSGPINVTNGTCKVGMYVKNGSAGDYIDCLSLNFHSYAPTALTMLTESKASAYAYHGRLNIKVNDAEIRNVEIYNTLGQLIFSDKGIKSDTFTRTINEKGILLVKVYTSKGIITKKVYNQ